MGLPGFLSGLWNAGYVGKLGSGLSLSGNTLAVTGSSNTIQQSGTSIGTAGTLNFSNGLSASVAGGVATLTGFDTIQQGGTSIGAAGTLNFSTGLTATVAGGVASVSATGGSGGSGSWFQTAEWYGSYSNASSGGGQTRGNSFVAQTSGTILGASFNLSSSIGTGTTIEATAAVLNSGGTVTAILAQNTINTGTVTLPAQNLEIAFSPPGTFSAGQTVWIAGGVSGISSMPLRQGSGNDCAIPGANYAGGTFKAGVSHVAVGTVAVSDAPGCYLGMVKLATP